MWHWLILNGREDLLDTVGDQIHDVFLVQCFLNYQDIELLKRFVKKSHVILEVVPSLVIVKLFIPFV